MNLSVGIKVDGFQERKITDDDLQVCKASKIVVYLDKEANDRLIDYYMTVRKILRQGDNKLLILINEDDNPNVAQAITHLCLEYGCYNIYKVVNESVIDKEYVLDMFKRDSSQDEVQMYIGSEDEAYETITEALLHITECCIENKLDDLQDYIIQNKDLIQKDFGLSHTVKVGAEVKVTPQFAVRAGANWTTSPMNAELRNGEVEVFTAGTVAHYTLDKGSSLYSVGLGYRFTPHFYMDLACVYRQYKETAYAFSNVIDKNDNVLVKSEGANLKTNTTQIALTLGYKF